MDSGDGVVASLFQGEVDAHQHGLNVGADSPNELPIEIKRVDLHRREVKELAD